MRGGTKPQRDTACLLPGTFPIVLQVPPKKVGFEAVIRVSLGVLCLCQRHPGSRTFLECLGPRQERDGSSRAHVTTLKFRTRCHFLYSDDGFSLLQTLALPSSPPPPISGRRAKPIEPRSTCPCWVLNSSCSMRRLRNKTRSKTCLDRLKRSAQMPAFCWAVRDPHCKFAGENALLHRAETKSCGLFGRVLSPEGLLGTSVGSLTGIVDPVQKVWWGF